MTDTTVAARTDTPVAASPIIRILAKGITYLFHPLFITTYVMGFLIFFHPFAFVSFDHKDKVLKFINIVFCDAFLPLFSVFLMWRLQFVQSMLVRSQKDRTIPYMMAMIFYWWTWHLYQNWEEVPVSAIHFLLGAFLAICVAFFCNIFFKISMHSVAMGGALMFFVLFGFTDTYASGLYIAVALLLTGLVCSSRLILAEHSGFEVWTGLLAGMVTQLVAWQF
ncbi:MAG TPA: hypothetical protein VGQ51_09295 [Puia sp.]|jgi:hypothetical protein|nr:hypothetical protein [Puia sp.]